MSRLVIKLVITSIIFLAGLIAYAEPIVLGEETDTKSASKHISYFDFLLRKSEDDNKKISREDRDYSKYPISFEGLLPITSELMTPGRVTSRKPGGKLAARPFCMVGHDDFSIKWILQNRKYLEQLNAVCFVVQVETVEQLEVIRKALKPVPWQLMNGDEIASKLKIKHYPVVISNAAIEQ